MRVARHDRGAWSRPSTEERRDGICWDHAGKAHDRRDTETKQSTWESMQRADVMMRQVKQGDTVSEQEQRDADH